MKNKEAKAKLIADVFSAILGNMTGNDIKRVVQANDKCTYAAFNLGTSAQLEACTELDKVLQDSVQNMTDHDLAIIVNVLTHSTVQLNTVDKML